jgi:heme oxygenase
MYRTLSLATDSLNDFAETGEEGPMSEGRTASSGRYALSFTTGALLAREGSTLGTYYLARRDWEQVRNEAVEGNFLQARTHSSDVRLVRETVRRLSVLTDDEVELLVEATASERVHLMWAAACRRYELIGEFAEEVLRERFLLLAQTLGYEEFDSFVRAKGLWHEELAALKDSTLQKLRSNVFKMLREAELLSDAGKIMPAVLSERVAARLSARTPSDLRFFPTQQEAVL